MGMSWDVGDTALTIANPAYGLYRLFGGKSWTSNDVPDAVAFDVTKTAAYKAMMDKAAAADARGQAADQQQADALRALAALRSAPAQSAAPISVNVPSFALGYRGRTGR